MATHKTIHKGKSIERTHNEDILTLKLRHLFFLQRYSKRLKKSDITYLFLMPKNMTKKTHNDHLPTSNQSTGSSTWKQELCSPAPHIPKSPR